MVTQADPPPGDRAGLNPDLRRSVDRDYSDGMHGSEPLATVSVKKNGPAVWPVIWAVVTIAAILITIWLVI